MPTEIFRKNTGPYATILTPMIAPPRQQVTQILIDWSEGDREAADRLMPLVYDELRQLARSYLQRERADHTLQATGLVHEAYLRLVDQTTSPGRIAPIFSASLPRSCAASWSIMRAGFRASKRGGEWEKVEFDEALALAPSRSVDLIALDDALLDLAKLKPEHSQIVELRFFGGLTFEEVGRSPRHFFANRGTRMEDGEGLAATRGFFQREAMMLPAAERYARVSELFQAARTSAGRTGGLSGKANAATMNRSAGR